LSETYVQKIRDQILDYGFTVQYVGQTVAGEGPPFAYTVGRTMHERPELLISGPFSPEDMHGLLTNLVELDNEAPIEVGARIPTDSGAHEFLAIACSTEPLAVARAVFGEVAGLQLLWPDVSGRLPSEPDYAHPGNQTIYAQETV